MRKLIGGFLLAGALLAGGCSNTAGIQASGTDADDVRVEDHMYFGSLRVGPTTTDVINDLYRAKVTFKNTRNDTRTLQYRFGWYTADGAQVASNESTWTPFVLYGQEERTLTGVAPSQDVAGFRVHVRDLRANKTFKTNFFKLK